MPWLRELSDACHERGDDADHPSWTAYQLKQGRLLPVLAPSAIGDAAHRSFPKTAEDRDLTRIVSQYANERMQASELDGIELEAYGHFMDGFWSPASAKTYRATRGALFNCSASTTRCACSFTAI